MVQMLSLELLFLIKSKKKYSEFYNWYFNLNSYEDDINKRRTIANYYDERLSHLDELQLPPPPKLDGANFDVFQNYEIQADKRDALRQYLADNNVGTIIQWGGKAVHQWEALGFRQKLPFTERFFERCLLLPMNTFLILSFSALLFTAFEFSPVQIIVSTPSLLSNSTPIPSLVLNFLNSFPFSS